MKFYSLLIIILLAECVLGLKSQTSMIALSNSETSSILKSYDPSLDIDTACVTCRYIAQKIYKVFEIDSKCTDIVSTKLINQRESLLKKEPDIVSKWTNVYNVQKDYYTRIIPKIKEIKKGTKQNIDVRYKDYFTINQSFLNGDWIKCEYPELNKSTCLVSKNNTNTLTVTFEFYEQLSNVTHQSIIWNNSLYLIITAESIAQSTTNYYTFIHNTIKPLDKERKDFMQDKETGLVTITLYYK